MDFAFMGFAPLSSEFTTSFLDLSSMQFGDVGRRFGDPARGGGEALFVLDTSKEYERRMACVADVDIGENTKISTRIGTTPKDEWLKEVARRVRDRWEKRDEEKWCGHCGSPVPIGGSRCSGCKAAWFCGKDHQAMAWPFHKGYCAQH
ncbi:hypothetical protein K505DRAFT_325657 [Melanomma pulvis-pyrius CBS 109.77]|uniref:MYND-type domain-containing protein n=1 Tax=Melanomma pulvis-pyrius CBS 109.77 TaxID=1314802 RepID=A0A6A6X9Q5_9PLEO|nr:hypothetical protein K505DRAFT_325657 [Melanomma pulvis-pyrius CBS 109.77]